MNYKRQKQKYKHKYFEKEKKYVLGCDLDMPDEEMERFTTIPLYIGGIDYEKLFQINNSDVLHILQSTVFEWNEKENRERIFNAARWDVMLDFILYKFDSTTMDIAKLIKPLKCINVEYNKIQTNKILNDIISKTRSGKGNVRNIGKEIHKYVCRYYKITESIIETGEGFLYTFEGGNDYTLEKIEEYSENHNEDFELLDMISEITGLEKSEIKAIPLVIALEVPVVNAKVFEFIDKFMDELIKKGV